jgi:hypothetical protein
MRTSIVEAVSSDMILVGQKRMRIRNPCLELAVASQFVDNLNARHKRKSAIETNFDGALRARTANAQWVARVVRR